MKKIKYLFIALILGFSTTFSSCVDLDLTPRGMLDENVLFSSEHGIQTFLAIIYNELPTEDFQFSLHPSSRGYIRRGSLPAGVNNWETAKFHTAGFAEAVSRLDYGASAGIMFTHWDRPFEMIRQINTFLHGIPNFGHIHSEQRINELIGEARFLRAFYYFSMARLYGGLPLVSEVLNPALPIYQLQLPRATEFETYMFIYEDLRFAMENMPATAVRGRATRYTAAALMTRAMLHAASIANFFDYVPTIGPATQAGLQGMRRTQAADFYRKVIEAADFITNGGRHTLHRTANLEQAFVEIFTIPTVEEIFVRQGLGAPPNTPTVSSHLHNSWDNNVLPLGSDMATHVGTHLHPSWNLLQLFQMPAIAEYNAQGQLVPVRFACRNELWDNDEMEPRARATFFFSGMMETYSRTVMDFQAGVFTSLGPDGNATVDQLTPSPPLLTNALLDVFRHRHMATGPFPFSTYVTGFGNVRIAGTHGVRWSGDEGQTVTGVTIRKYVNPNPGPGERAGANRGSQDFKVFRYGEIVLNRAEARFELGLLTDDVSLQQQAFVDVNLIRDRAGARHQAWIAGAQDVGYRVNAVYVIDENRQFIRDERARELAFEHHTFFDLRRWRVAHTKFDQFFHRGLFPYYVLNEGKWIFLNHGATFTRVRNMSRGNYYRQLPGDAIGRNPNLMRNDD